MTRNGSTWLVVFVILGLYSLDISLRSSVDADPQPKRNPHERSRIALVDMARVFNGSKDFERRRDQLKRKITDNEETAKSKQKAVTDLISKYERLDPNSERRSDLDIQMEKLGKEFEEFRRKI